MTKKADPLTKAICNKGFRGNSSILPRIKIRVGGQESSPQSFTAYSLGRQTAQKHQRMFFRDKLNLRENRLFNSCICVDYFVTLCCKSINYNLCNTYREKSEISYRFFVWNR